jgi:Arc/MetJ-type ribon-helix-helix transcriptional regulator
LLGVELGVEYTVEQIPHMETIQVVLDKKLLQAADRVVRRKKTNRSALIRDALRQHLRQLDIRAKEAQERKAYSRQPQKVEEWRPWEEATVWPAE